MIKLVYETPEVHKEYTSVKSIVIEVEDEASRDQMLEVYEKFLQAIGYYFDGHIDVIVESEG
jgi:hypothetical protein